MAILLLIAALAAGTILLVHSPAKNPVTSSDAGYSLVRMKRQNLAISTSLDGTLGYGAASPIPLQASGVVTWLARSGSVVRRGEILERVNDRPVVLMYGTTPAYRTMFDTAAVARDAAREAAHAKAPPPPMTGRDIGQVKENLSALGYAGFTVDDKFTSATARAVASWQASVGLPATGTIRFGDVVFLPGPVRVVTNPSTLGTTDVASSISSTSTHTVVTVSAPAASLGWARLGTQVTVALPDQKRVRGTVTSVGSSASTGEGGEATVPVRIKLRRSRPSQESGPVTVTYVARRVRHALTVPVTALVALAEGGYGVQLADGSYVAVTPGLYANGVVQVTGDLAVGTEVRDAP